ncbi:MAG TPA: hypothetical protein VNM92_00615 [Thermoanaerobaculia bacterium]|nr:hypothetical protein [Thermoanaerobaculia bacterium]
MTVKQFHGDLQIEEDLEFQRRAWKVERAGWIVLFLATLAALAGACGGGMLAEGNGMAGRASVEYPRLARYTAPMKLQVTLPIAGNQSWMAVDNDYLGRVKFEAMIPSPDSAQGGPNETRLVFRGAGETLTVHIRAEANHVGIVRGRLRTADGVIPISMFVFP